MNLAREHIDADGFEESQETMPVFILETRIVHHHSKLQGLHRLKGLAGSILLGKVPSTIIIMWPKVHFQSNILSQYHQIKGKKLVQCFLYS
jgi:hypothetical protein